MKTPTPLQQPTAKPLLLLAVGTGVVTVSLLGVQLLGAASSSKTRLATDTAAAPSEKFWPFPGEDGEAPDVVSEVTDYVDPLVDSREVQCMR